MDKLDADVELMLSIKDGYFVPRSNLNVVVSRSYNRRPLPEPYESDINVTWDKRVAENSKVWNGTKFRIDTATAENGSATFHIGLTDYKDFIGTNWSPNARTFVELGLKLCGNTHAYMSDALGVGAFVLTADDHIILLKRSAHCAEAPGMWDIPGGHPEPKELVGDIPISEIDVETLSPQAIITEIFDSTLREIVDEVNIPLDTLSDPLLIGIARNTTSAGRPSSEYLVRCSLTSTQVKERYLSGGHAEADESSDILLLPVIEVMCLQESDAQLWSSIAPSAKGCITLYRLSQQR